MMSKGLQRGDVPTVTASVLVSTVIVMAFSLIVDLLYSLIDPVCASAPTGRRQEVNEDGKLAAGCGRHNAGKLTHVADPEGPQLWDDAFYRFRRN